MVDIINETIYSVVVFTGIKEDEGMDNIGSVERMDFFKVFEMQHFVFDSTRHQTTQRVGNENRKIDCAVPYPALSENPC